MKDGGELEAEGKRGQSNVKEIRLICSYLHEAFIADPNLAKLVHFQVNNIVFISVKFLQENRTCITP